MQPTAAITGARELRFPRYRLTVIEGPDRERTIDGASEELRHAGNLSAAAREVRMDRNHLRELAVRHRVRADEA